MNIKELLGSTDSLAYFDLTAETQITSDAFPLYLGATFAQKKTCDNFRQVNYARCSILQVECCCSQIEQEISGIYFANERFKMHL